MSLTPEDNALIESAVKAAEEKTRGEICCVITEEASAYPDAPLMWGAGAALASPLVLLALGLDPLGQHWSFGGWQIAHFAAADAEARTALLLLVAFQTVVFFTVALCVSHAPLRRLLTPRWVKHDRVHQRAREQFVARSMHRTRERTAVLIFASLKDRMAVIIADEGINAKVKPDAWDRAIGRLVTGMRTGRAGDGFVAAINQCGELLAEHFPATEDNPNELPDAPATV